MGHDPADPLKTPVDAPKIQSFYQKWYTPDAMTLIIVGNVDARSVAEQINKTFGELKENAKRLHRFPRSLRCELKP